MTDNFSRDFMCGQRDCREGKPHQPGQSAAYDRGYATEYEIIQINDVKTIRERFWPAAAKS